MTLAYAQSLDGCIAASRRRPLPLSGPSTQRLTHTLRTMHDAILVGIGTVLADDPRLDVRLVRGPSPRPIVVDSHLRIPADARLLSSGSLRSWVASLATADHATAQRIQAHGGRVLTGPATSEGRVDLGHLLDKLGALSVRSVMVEGGAAIIRSFLAGGLVDYAVVCLSPRFVGGVPALGEGEPLGIMPHLRAWRCEAVGDDVVIAGDVDWSR